MELKFAKRGLGESKAQHFLRLYGAGLLGALQTADQTIDTTLGSIATGITDFGRKQAALGVRVGGMGVHLCLRSWRADVSTCIRWAADGKRTRNLCASMRAGSCKGRQTLHLQLKARVWRAMGRD